MMNSNYASHMQSSHRSGCTACGETQKIKSADRAARSQKRQQAASATRIGVSRGVPSTRSSRSRSNGRGGAQTKLSTISNRTNTNNPNSQSPARLFHGTSIIDKD